MPLNIGIVGAGFTGAMLAVGLVRFGGPAVAVTLIDSGPVGRGLAYGTDNPDHLLNVRVANMSAFADDPSHFLRWLWMQDIPAYAAVPPSGHAFVSRRTYGDYVATVFREMRARHPGAVTVIEGGAVQLHPGLHPAVTLADGRRLYFDRVALCIGNFPASPPAGIAAAALASPRFVNDPWRWRLAAVRPDDHVLILGSGLTMADTVQSLLGKGHIGRIDVVSRHGLLPQDHAPGRAYDLPPLSGGLRPLFRTLRREAAAAQRRGYDWRHVIDAMRPHTRTLWQSLTPAERARFLRHLRPYWDSHRHRLPPEIADTIAGLRDQGRLCLTAGRVAVAWDGPRDDMRFAVTVTPRGQGAPRPLSPAWIVNCTGPQCDYRAIDDALVRGALDRGVIRADALHLGLDVSAGNAVIDADGRPSPNIVAVGPPTRGRFWEVTAVPDIRGECDRVARALTAGLPRRASGPAAVAD